MLSQTESLSKEQKAIFFFQRKLLLDEDSHALNSVSNYLKTKKLHIKFTYFIWFAVIKNVSLHWTTYSFW